MKQPFDDTKQLATIVELLGDGTAAELLGVARSDIANVRQGVARFSPESRRTVSQLYYLLDRLTQVIRADFVVEWLSTPQPHLSNATPAVVFRLKGPSPVIEVLEAIGETAYR